MKLNFTFSKMKKLFYIGIIGLILFEILNVYFIMPMPGSQRMRSIDIAYFFNTYRWIFRGFFGFLTLVGIYPMFQYKRWIAVVGCILVGIARSRRKLARCPGKASP